MCGFITKDQIPKSMSEKDWMSERSIFTYHYEHLHGSRQHEYWISMLAKQLRVSNSTSQFNEEVPTISFTVYIFCLYL